MVHLCWFCLAFLPSLFIGQEPLRFGCPGTFRFGANTAHPSCFYFSALQRCWQFHSPYGIDGLTGEVQ